MPEIDTDFAMFQSIVTGLSKHLFPTGTIKNEASDVEIASKLLNNKDITRFLTPDFISKMKKKLSKKALGIVKQAELDRRGFDKIAGFDPEVHDVQFDKD